MGSYGESRLPSTLIHSGLVVTVDRERRIIRDGALLIEDGKIVEVGKTETLRKRNAETRIDAGGMVVMPGFVDAHVHVTTDHLVRGLVPDNLPLFTSVFDWEVPLHVAVKPDEEYLSAKFAMTEFLKTGTTCFGEAGTTLNPEAVVRAAEEMGVRGTVARWAWDVPRKPERYAMGCDEALKGIEDTIRKLHGRADGRVRVWTSVIGQNTCSDELLVGAKELADKHQTHMHMHQSAVQEEVNTMLRENGERPMEHFERIGIMGPNLTMTHMVHLNEKELAIVKRHDTKMVFCPTSANKLGYGALRSGLIPEAMGMGICVALGCDSANSSDTFDMLRVMHIMAGSWKDARVDPATTSAERVIEMATIDGARALGLEKETGSLEAGKKADVVLFSRSAPEWNPLFNVVNSLVYSAPGSSVDTVLVDGRVLMRNRRIRGLDEDELYRHVQEAGQRLIDRSGLKPQSRWPIS